MKINLKHKLGLGNLEIISNSDDPDKRIEVKIVAKPSSDEMSSELPFYLEETFRREIDGASGHYGHTVHLDSTTNLDLRAACDKLPSFEVKSITPPIITKTTARWCYELN